MYLFSLLHTCTFLSSQLHKIDPHASINIALYSNLNHKNKAIILLQFSDFSQFTDPELFGWRGGQSPLMKDPSIVSKIYAVNLSPRLSQREHLPYARVTVHCGREIIRTLRDYQILLWNDTNSWKTKTSLWASSQSWGLQRSGNQWSFRGQAINGVLAMSFFLGCGQWFGYTVRDLEGTWFENWWYFLTVILPFF